MYCVKDKTAIYRATVPSGIIAERESSNGASESILRREDSLESTTNANALASTTEVILGVDEVSIGTVRMGEATIGS